MPALCREIRDGGIGFDYRLGMGVPDMWIWYLKDKVDTEWSVAHMVHMLTNYRKDEKVLCYSESHDQAIVGDRTASCRLFGESSSATMTKSNNSTKINRGMALHKMIRLLTQSLGGKAYLNFMGNEFGHPDWIDFPREGNKDSYKYCRRQWSLLNDP
jgi:1,4-alpha-glucan branching enzyme